MKFKIGDRVRFLNEVGGGKIVGFQDKNIVTVCDQDGFEIPVMVSEIVKIEDASDDTESVEESSNEIIHEDTKTIKTTGETKFDGNFGIHFGLVKNDDNTYKLYLINDSDHNLFFCISVLGEKFDGHYKSGQLEDNTKLFLDTLSKEELHNIKTLRFQVVLFTHSSFEYVKPVVKEVSFNKVILKEENFTSNDFFNSKAQVFKIENEDLAEEIAKLKQSDFSKIIEEKDGRKSKSVGDFLKEKKPKNEIEEVDLHIEEILENWKDMSPGAIINAQLSRFEISLETALKSNAKRIVFIHGVGNGKLKYELRKKLDIKYPDLRYQDASFKEYGYGATMVILK